MARGSQLTRRMPPRLLRTMERVPRSPQATRAVLMRYLCDVHTLGSMRRSRVGEQGNCGLGGQYTIEHRAGVPFFRKAEPCGGPPTAHALGTTAFVAHSSRVGSGHGPSAGRIRIAKELPHGSQALWRTLTKSAGVPNAFRGHTQLMRTIQMHSLCVVHVLASTRGTRVGNALITH